MFWTGGWIWAKPPRVWSQVLRILSVWSLMLFRESLCCMFDTTVSNLSSLVLWLTPHHSLMYRYIASVHVCTETGMWVPAVSRARFSWVREEWHWKSMKSRNRQSVCARSEMKRAEKSEMKYQQVYFDQGRCKFRSRPAICFTQCFNLHYAWEVEQDCACLNLVLSDMNVENIQQIVKDEAC